MDTKLQVKLFKKYPKIFRQKDLPMTQTCLCWGCECGDGWYDLIDKLCSMLQWDIDKNRYPQIEATQIKEKYGTLRFYYTHAEETYTLKDITWFDRFVSWLNKYVIILPTRKYYDRNWERHKEGMQDGMISFAEHLSGHICEDCGTNVDVTRNDDGWISTLCVKCRKKRNKKS